MKIRSLTESDVPKRGRPKRAVAKIRAVHHLVAQLYAKGMKPTEIAPIVNRTSATVRNWLDSPANAELVAQYCGAEGERITSEMEYRIALRRKAGTMAMEKLVEMLEADEIESEKSLLAIAADSDDRTGLGRQETKVNLNMDLGARLDRAIERGKKLDEERGKVIELKSVRRL
jgi:transposase